MFRGNIADQAERPLESFPSALLSCCPILFSQSKNLTFRKDALETFCFLSVFSPDAVLVFSTCRTAEGAFFSVHLRMLRRVLDTFSVNKEWTACPPPTPTSGLGELLHDARIMGLIWMAASCHPRRSTWRLPGAVAGRKFITSSLLTQQIELFVYLLAIWTLCSVYCLFRSYLFFYWCFSESVSWTRVRKLQPAGWLPVFKNNV